MITLQSDTSIVVSSLLSALDDITDVDKVLGRAVFDSFAGIKQRIQQKGGNAKGGKIGNYAKNKAGTGLGSWARKRQEAGRQTNFIDLTFSGDLMNRGFSVIGINDKSIGIGFLNSESAKIAGFIEDRFGRVFILSDSEIETFEASVIEDINEIINGS